MFSFQNNKAKDARNFRETKGSSKKTVDSKNFHNPEQPGEIEKVSLNLTRTIVHQNIKYKENGWEIIS